ncbi:non-hydrolyzing UDP-N-acetylglucosamine 2-epimerase [Paremcibacter congregatus]|uniref:UDP-N-acetylglucosamine 2-epimerase (Non-hydrolyzing) n=1 Tax=Paremcibacter congregatus TaxID=2043170 RepID=A0A2G4YUS8_9PROT|nr:UDP-N-acetylglucosamine 2-epimerase (non-hydrolyzing) [Paremcibacter congregatus]PHZ86043.1 UDP-N-acetylglucosamine 2-epimerase (non-hydrolyzing) [Paremcibacter congregatus]QDE27009.1 UDP-N-acetylglucosamine 2-epimerase (non-hydrolyzing) [Paremcibacter congregatus]
MTKKIIHLIAAARPNFMKIAPLYHALNRQDWCTPRIIHTGQHYDANMSDSIFADLMLPQPHFHLGIGSGTHAHQIGNVMMKYEQIVLEQERPDFLVVVGDVNPTAACSQVATKLHIPVAHLEAGLRSGDRRMPEEINRLVTDAICDALWTPSPDADENLKREGHPDSRVVRVGNIMMDSFELLRDKIEAEKSPEKFGLEEGNYGVVTLHRPSNVDGYDTLKKLVDQLIEVSQKIQLIFAVHPRTRNSLQEHGFWDGLQEVKGLKLVEPVSYTPFMSLVKSAKLIITDSGGIQEETTYLNIPCLTLRENTERPITITEGTNKLVPLEELQEHVDQVLRGEWRTGHKPDLWDGKTADRVVAEIHKALF